MAIDGHTKVELETCPFYAREEQEVNWRWLQDSFQRCLPFVVCFLALFYDGSFHLICYPLKCLLTPNPTPHLFTRLSTRGLHVFLFIAEVWWKEFYKWDCQVENRHSTLKWIRWKYEMCNDMKIILLIFKLWDWSVLCLYFMCVLCFFFLFCLFYVFVFLTDRTCSCQHVCIDILVCIPCQTKALLLNILHTQKKKKKKVDNISGWLGLSSTISMSF